MLCLRPFEEVLYVRRLSVALVLVTAAMGASGSARIALAITPATARVVAQAAAGRAMAAVKAAQPSHLQHNGDFNGDGWPDLAAGSPEDDVQGKVDSGTLNVIYGSPSGLQLSGNTDWTESKTGLTGDGKGDFFGRSAATGDFNHDGYDDLAIAAIRHRVGGVNHAGAVYVLYGSARGINPPRAPDFPGESPGRPGDAAGKVDPVAGAPPAPPWNNHG